MSFRWTCSQWSRDTASSAGSTTSWNRCHTNDACCFGFARSLRMRDSSKGQERVPPTFAWMGGRLIRCRWDWCGRCHEGYLWEDLKRGLFVIEIVFVPFTVKSVLRGNMTLHLKEMLVGFERLGAAPCHVAYQLFLFALQLTGRLRLLCDQVHFLGHVPMSETVNVELNLHDIAEMIPMRFEGLVAVGLPSL